MCRTRPPYPAEFRARIVELVRAGRMPEELSREFEPSAQTITNWVGQANVDEGRAEAPAGALASAEKAELQRLRRENKQLKLEREILAKGRSIAPTPGSHARPTQFRSRRLRIRESDPGRSLHPGFVSSHERLAQWLLCLADMSAVGSSIG